MSTTELLLISGSLREQSTNTAALRTAAANAGPGIITHHYTGAAFPQFNPDEDTDPLPEPVAELRARIHAVDAVLLAVPEYAGGLPGSFKNLIDWTIADDSPGSLNGKPLAWINAAERGAEKAHAALREVLGYAGSVIVERACAHVPVAHESVGADGLLTDPAASERVTAVLHALVAAVRD
ncbi:NADPH-dependent FMN reductase [Sciscionella sediminilitoris]|uniref:NADPH-dependent FMN reductase n=1 Tax=Sciscionella sediminilitoris TaxID=1445613 RepID=UPI0004DF225E|nr:NADPH-dependent FMN reductase [Sciscionella sp. SE31]